MTGNPPREPPHISLKELSDICSEILAKKPIHPDMLAKLAAKMASLPSDEELAIKAEKRRIYKLQNNREYYAKQKQRRLNG